MHFSNLILSITEYFIFIHQKFGNLYLPITTRYVKSSAFQSNFLKDKKKEKRKKVDEPITTYKIKNKMNKKIENIKTNLFVWRSSLSCCDIDINFSF